MPTPNGESVKDKTVDEYLSDAERDLKPIWPKLAKRLSNVL